MVFYHGGFAQIGGEDNSTCFIARNGSYLGAIKQKRDIVAIEFVKAMFTLRLYTVGHPEQLTRHIYHCDMAVILLC